MSRIAIIGSTGYQDKMRKHKEALEKEGHEVFIPAFDNLDGMNETQVCTHNLNGIKQAKEVHVIWDARSQGTIFDMGMCFVLNKPVKIIYMNNKTFPNLLQQMEQNNINKKEIKPWGYYEVLEKDEYHVVKKIVVNPNARLSLQKHGHRYESWYIEKGFGKVDIDGVHITLAPGTFLSVIPGQWHRLTAFSDGLTMIEVWTGDILDEEDIERAEDDYGRIKK